MSTEVRDTRDPLDPVSPRVRVMSIDALRGFDMFWIIGGDAIASAIGKLTNNDAVNQVTAEFSDHMPWVGFRFYDMIFPLFLFIIGATLPFSVGRRIDQGDSKKKLIQKIVTRAAILFLLGLIYNGLFRFNGWDHIRFFGVLQRQAFGYCVAAILFVTTKPKTQIAIFVGILLGYWALMALAPVPTRGDLWVYSEWGNFANYVDRLFLGPHQMYEKYGDPEGPVSMIPAICTALMGLFAGRWLKSERPQKEKVLGLVIAGVISLAIGLAWAPLFPVIKKIWTSSYVLVAGGFSLELLGLFYYIVDVRGWKKWCFPFVVIGMNPITIYLLSEVVDFGGAARYFVGGISKQVPTYSDLILSIAVIVVEWLFLWFLYKKKVFIRV